MARTDTLGNFLTDVADAIRTKAGTSETIQASNFDTAISNIPSGGGNDAITITIVIENEETGDIIPITDASLLEIEFDHWQRGWNNPTVSTYTILKCNILYVDIELKSGETAHATVRNLTQDTTVTAIVEE